MKKINKFLSVFLTLIMIVSIIPMSSISASAAVQTGTCGENVTWAFDESTGILTISGSGEMYDFEPINYYGTMQPTAPWQELYVKKVIVSNGVTSIGSYAFCVINAEEIIIGDDVATIGEYGIYACGDLKTVSIGKSVAHIGDFCFSNCFYLNNIEFDSDNQYFVVDGNALYTKDKSELIRYMYDWSAMETSFAVPSSVTVIGEGAFDTTYLSSVVLGENVKIIKDCAFYGCQNLELTIPENVESIGSSAFVACKNIYVNDNNRNFYMDNGGLIDSKNNRLIYYSSGNTNTSYTISDNIKIIEDTAFCYNPYLTEIIMKDGLESIGDLAFAYCTNLNRITVPDTVTDMGTQVFWGCANLEEAKLSKALTTIPFRTFLECVKLKKVEFGNVNTIDAQAFWSCHGLTEISIPKSVAIISIGAFGNCNELKDVYYASSEDDWSKITIIWEENEELLNATIHYDCHTHNFTSIVTPPTCTEQGYITYTCSCGDSYKDNYVTALGHEYTSEITKPATHKENGVKTYTCIRCPHAYTEAIPATDVHNYIAIVTPPTCTEQGYTTYLCECGDGYIANEVSPYGHNYVNGVCTICNDNNPSGTCGDNLAWTFDESTGTLTIFGTGVMYDFYYESPPWEKYNNNITSIKIDNNVTTVGANAFAHCANLTSIICSNSMTKIGAYAFSYCTKLTNITFPDSLITIDESAFKGCTSLTNVIVPDSVTKIVHNAFFDCENIVSITVDKNNQYYSSDEYGVLFNKNKTELIQYPSGNVRTSYTIPDSVVTIDWAFKNCRNLTSVKIGKGVTMIDGSFYGCEKLISITIPDNVTTIGMSAFQSCTNLSNITISNSVSTISSNAFVNCNSLNDVYYSGTEMQWNEILIGNYNDPLLNANIHYNYTGCVHISKIITIPATCTIAGMEYNVCEICGETIGDSTVIPAKGHTAGEWEIILEPTYEADGKKVKKCTICGEIVAEEVIPMLVKNVVTDEETGVSMDFDNTDYNGVVDIVVEESFDGKAFDVIDTSLNISQKFIYDITMTVDGEAVQLNGTVTVKIPLPAGYDPARSFVYHVDTVTGKVEKMPATYENGYLVFETTHFSYYAVVEEAVNEYNYTFGVQNPSRTEIRNKDGIILHANVEGNAPDGSYVRWESNNGNFDKSADGSNLKIIAKNKGYTTFTAILCDADGNELARDSVEMYSKSGFFDKIGGFFRSLFGTTKVYEY